MPKKDAKAAPETPAAEKKTCGLIMPISARDGLPESHWLEVRAIIEKSLSSLNLDVRLVSDGEASDVIHKTILQRLYTSTVCVCDISTLNPNVMFELGIRLSFSKPTVIIGDDATPLPFDTGLVRRFPYPRDLRYQKIQRFMSALKKAVASALEAAAKGDQSSSFMSALGPIKVPQLDTQEVTGIQFVMDELKEIKTMLLARKRGDSPGQRRGRNASLEELINAIDRLHKRKEIPDLPEWDAISDRNRVILLSAVLDEVKNESPEVDGVQSADLKVAVSYLRKSIG